MREYTLGRAPRRGSSRGQGGRGVCTWEGRRCCCRCGCGPNPADSNRLSLSGAPRGPRVGDKLRDASREMGAGRGSAAEARRHRNEMQAGGGREDGGRTTCQRAFDAGSRCPRGAFLAGRQACRCRHRLPGRCATTSAAAAAAEAQSGGCERRRRCEHLWRGRWQRGWWRGVVEGGGGDGGSRAGQAGASVTPSAAMTTVVRVEAERPQASCRSSRRYSPSSPSSHGAVRRHEPRQPTAEIGTTWLGTGP